MKLKYKEILFTDRYLINRKIIPYYDFCVYGLPECFKKGWIFGLSFYSWHNFNRIRNVSSGIKIKRLCD